MILRRRERWGPELTFDLYVQHTWRGNLDNIWEETLFAKMNLISSRKSLGVESSLSAWRGQHFCGTSLPE